MKPLNVAGCARPGYTCAWNESDIGVRLVQAEIEEVGSAYVALDPGRAAS